MTQEEMNILVPEKLKRIEEENHVTVLYAAESGSRAWGFESPDSDFDVRFIYKRPRSEYLRLESMRDVIEIPMNETWDVSGWDLAKALRLLNKSNPALYDWLGSPVCYVDNGFRERVFPLLQIFFSEKKMLCHYYGIASREIKAIFGESTVKPKRYFYALRSVLACLWIEQNGTAPPVRFSDLTDAVLPDEVRPSLENLYKIKRNSPEKTGTEHLKVIDKFLKEKQEEIYAVIGRLPKERPIGWEKLNAFFAAELDG